MATFYILFKWRNNLIILKQNMVFKINFNWCSMFSQLKEVPHQPFQDASIRETKASFCQVTLQRRLNGVNKIRKEITRYEKQLWRLNRVMKVKYLNQVKLKLLEILIYYLVLHMYCITWENWSIWGKFKLLWKHKLQNIR